MTAPSSRTLPPLFFPEGPRNQEKPRRRRDSHLLHSGALLAFSKREFSELWVGPKSGEGLGGEKERERRGC